MTRLVAIDCATERLSLAAVALGPDGAVREAHARDLEGGAASSRLALPALLALLGEAGWPRDSLSAIGFGQGPGAFTGLRTACAVAQGLAFGLGRPVLPLDSLCLVAEAAAADEPAFPRDAGPTWVAMDARMDEVYAAAYRRAADGSWATVLAPRLTDPAALAEAWASQPPALVTGNAPAAFGERLAVPPGVPVRAGEAGRAAALGRLAAAAWRAGRACPADQALPVYLRDKVALTTAEREARRPSP